MIRSLKSQRAAQLSALCISFAACASANPNPATSSGAIESIASSRVRVQTVMPSVAMVGDTEIGVDEFLAECLHEGSQLMKQVLDQVVLTRLVELEVDRLQVVLPDDQLALAQATALSQFVDQIEEESPGIGLEAWVSTRLGLDPDQFKARLKQRVERELLTQRVVRAWILGQERTEIRILLAANLAGAEAALERYAAGEDFGELAKELSVDLSAKEGGRAAPVIRSETLLGTIAFETPVGEVSGPLEQQGRWLLVEVVSRVQGYPALWGVIREEVERSLLERGVEDPEFWQWKERMQRAHPVDITPLFRLAGEPEL
ncbi:MAG: peptidylprolyl isomerase [Planctomycetota bacterium]|nr:peptidylprolyl isomerase [Planctomycetota bacterium]